jgi:hypothetical protein
MRLIYELLFPNTLPQNLGFAYTRANKVFNNHRVMHTSIISLDKNLLLPDIFNDTPCNARKHTCFTFHHHRHHGLCRIRLHHLLKKPAEVYLVQR